jgi:L-seryl-tRNA(Ser) seleniumtransferase
VRADKLCLAALTATLRHYLFGEAEREIPVWQMVACPSQTLQARAQHWADVLQQGEVIAGLSTVGGGSLPEETLPTFLLALAPARLTRFLAKLRSFTPPVIGRIENERAVFDPRTVLPEQEEALLACIYQALRSAPSQ